jgi:hypothetical protein
LHPRETQIVVAVSAQIAKMPKKMKNTFLGKLAQQDKNPKTNVAKKPKKPHNPK